MGRFFSIENTQRFGNDFHAGLFQRLVGVAADVRRGAEVRQAQQLVLGRGRLVNKGVLGGGQHRPRLSGSRLTAAQRSSTWRK